MNLPSIDPDALYSICVESDYPDLVSLVLSNKAILPVCRDLLPYKKEVWRMLNSDKPEDEQKLYAYLTTPPQDPAQAAVIAQTLRAHYSLAFTEEQLKQRYLDFWVRMRAVMLRFGLNPALYLLDQDAAWRQGEIVLTQNFAGTFIQWGNQYYVKEGTQAYTDREYWDLMLKLVHSALTPRFWSDFKAQVFTEHLEGVGYIEDVFQSQADEVWDEIFEPYRIYDEEQEPDDYDY